MHYKDQKENHQELKATSLNGFKPQNNYVLCKKTFTNKDKRTQSGIYLFNEMYNKNQFLGNNIDRVFTVVKNPEKLTFKRWVTGIETKPEDIIVITPSEAVNCPKVFINDVEYYLVNYFNIKVVKRPNKGGEINGEYDIIPINGYVVMEDVWKIEKLNFFEKKKLDMPKGKVKWVGTPNKGYVNHTSRGKKIEDRDYGRDVKKGDIVFMSIFAELDESENKRYLEYDLFTSLNGNVRYFAMQRQFFDAIIEN